MDRGRARFPEQVRTGWDPNRLLRWTRGSADYIYGKGGAIYIL